MIMRGRESIIQVSWLGYLWRFPWACQHMAITQFLVLRQEIGINFLFYFSKWIFSGDPLIDGVRINSPHYLCKILTPNGVTNKTYTVVVSQFEKTTSIHYTLRLYSSAPFQFNEITNPCKYKKRLVGEWDKKTAGGCGNNPATYINNPTYKLEINSPAKTLIIDLKGPKQYQLGFDVICNNYQQDGGASGSSSQNFYKKSSGPYR